MSDSVFSSLEHQTLQRVRAALRPLDSKIDHSLWVGTATQMRQDLIYIRQLLTDAVAAIDEALDV